VTQRRQRKPVEEYLRQMAYSLITPESAGSAVVGLARMAAEDVGSAYVLTGAGLQKVP
jgi:hypothetical protein